MHSVGLRRFASVKWHPLVVAALAVAFIAMTSSRGKTSVLQLSDEDLVRLSSTIAEGRVTGLRSEWNTSHDQIHTIVTIRVGQTIKGAQPEDGLLTLRLLGGQVGDVVLTITDQAAFALDEDVIVFVRAGGPTLMPITGAYQGKLTVATDPSTGTATIVGRETSRDAFVRDLARIAAAQEGGR